MMNQSKRNRGGRMNAGGRTDKRQMYSPDSRPPRQQRGPMIDKNMNVDGVFKNPRMTHCVITLVGINVQVQVKNGTMYEGVLRTVSPKGDIVLEMAHMVEDNANGTLSSTPSRDRILGKLVIRNLDVITVNAANVDLEYAVKDSFTDSSISKFNGDVKEKDLKELQPWEGEASITDELLEDKSAIGWDANDMFKTNAQQFNVKSSYDDSLNLYTTKLEKSNTDEYKMREEQAMRLAAEIEGTEQYKKNIALENGEGDNEEALFSAVVRPMENGNSQMTGGPGKYIPPNKRHGGPPQGGNPNMSKPGRGNYSQQQQQYPPSATSAPHQHQQQQQQYPPPSSSAQHQQQQHSYQQQQQQMGGARNIHGHPPPASHHVKHETSNGNGDDNVRASMPASTAGPTIKTSPVSDHSAPSIDKQEHNPQYSHSKHETKKHNKGHDEKIQELKEFGKNFKLDDNKEKEKEKVYSSERQDSVNEESRDTVTSEPVPTGDGSVSVVPQPVQSESVSPTEQEQQPQHQQQQQSPVDLDSKSDPGDGQEKDDDITVTSKLNPNAKEFVYNPKAAVSQKQPTHQAPTPPRLQTQSPIIQSPLMGAAPVYPSPGQSFMIPPAPGMVLNSNPPQQFAAYNAKPKRAVVSVKPDPYPAASAVTGQPLLAQHNPHNPHNPHMMYIPPAQAQMMHPQPTGYSIGQMMPMPAPSNQRFVPPTSMQGMPPTSIHTGMEQSTPGGQPGQIYMPNHQQGPMPSHMPHGAQFSMGHLNISNPTNQQSSTQMNPTPHSAAGHHHPAPSPVHSNPNQQQPMNPGPHPPSSGTPQPPQGYSGQPTLQSHPPLQPSPHNPTSPQTMQQMPYHSHAHHISMQGSAGGQQQFSVPQQSNLPTPVTAHTHTQHMQPQFVMMPNVAPSAQLNHHHHHHLHGNHQFQNHIAGPGSMQPQIMSQPLGHPGQNHGQAPHPHNQMQHFPLQVHTTGGQPVQNYQPAQVP